MTLGPATVSIRSDLALSAAVRAKQQRGAPRIYRLDACSSHAAGGQPRLLHELRDEAPLAGDITYDPAGPTLTVRAHPDALSADNLLHLSYMLLESRMHQHGYLTLHAAAVARKGRAVLLLGSPGAGKTTTALRLCQDHGFQLLGNDLCVVGGPARHPHVLAGSTHLRLRHSSLTRAMPELLRFFPDHVHDPWRAKRDIAPQSLGIETASAPGDVALVTFIHADGDYHAVVDADGDTLVHRQNLYENALRYIRGGSSPWLVGDENFFGPYVPPLDSPAAHGPRTITLARLMALSRYLAGPPAPLAARIAGLLAAPQADAPSALSETSPTGFRTARRAPPSP